MTVEIHRWILDQFAGPEPKTILECGAHRGEDTLFLASLLNSTVHSFEPDPRNAIPRLPNVHAQRCAVWHSDGEAPFRLSECWGDRIWTESGSLREPSAHLTKWPGVKFGDWIAVKTICLDSYIAEHQIEQVDLLWMDVQGAEGDVLAGANETIRRTRFLYTEYSNDEDYSGQITLQEIRDFLGPEWHLLAKYTRNNVNNVLLERGQGCGL